MKGGSVHENSNETLDDFVKRIAKTVPCDHHPVKTKGKYSLTKRIPRYSGDKGMGKIAAVGFDKTRIAFKIKAKEWLADEQAQKDACKTEPWDFGPPYDKQGLVFFVKPGSRGQGYQKALRVLRVIYNKLP